MRTLSRHSAIVLACAFLGSGHAHGQATEQNGGPIIIPPQSSVFNQNSMALPSAPSVSGQDVVRGADGTTCQSAVASGGPYVDMGVLQSQDVYARDTAALYGRVVIPIGRRGRRVDGTQLYRLEIERMRMELELLRMGMRPGDALSMTPMQTSLAADEPEPPAVAGFVIPASTGASAVTARVTIDIAPPAKPALDHMETNLPDPSEIRFVQVGAFSSRDTAAALLKKLSGFVPGRGSEIRAFEGSRGTLHRALLGPMPSDEAEHFCAHHDGDCFIAEL